MKKSPHDPGLAQIDDLERTLVRAFDEKMVFHGIDVTEAARFRPGVVAQAAAVAARLRADYLARTPR